ncbi:MAG: hypothetical protein D6693_05070 [Planctomycetota bacterium]|nr:MAG: hypothetical protein D6693_05070 [Planctomycetota bacterium]
MLPGPSITRAVLITDDGRAVGADAGVGAVLSQRDADEREPGQGQTDHRPGAGHTRADERTGAVRVHAFLLIVKS